MNPLNNKLIKNEPIAKILFSAESAYGIPALADKLFEHPMAKKFDFIRSDERFYEILPKGANKGTLVTKIAEILGINPEKTIAVGDNDNDVSMLECAHIGIAVSNASESVKKVADFITVSNEEGAIAKIIDDLDRGSIVI